MKIEDISFIAVSEIDSFKKGDIVQVCYENGKKEFKKITSALVEDNVLALTKIGKFQAFKLLLKSKLAWPIFRLKSKYILFIKTIKK